MQTITPLFEPIKLPMLGMNSSADPATVRWRLIDNWRIARRSVQGRLGCSPVGSASTPPATGTYRGGWKGSINGTEYLVFAMRVSTTTRVYKVDTTTGAFVELTSSGPATRFTTDANVTFAAVRDVGMGDGVTLAGDYLYMSNGADTPRTCRSMTVGSTGLLYNFDLSTVSVGSYRPIPGGYFKVNDPANTTCSVSDADVTCADNGAAAPLNEVTVTVGTATDVGDWANIAFGASSCVNFTGSAESSASTLDLSNSNQLGILLYDPSSDFIHNYANIEVTQSAAQVQVYTASGIDRVDPAIQTLGGGYYLVCFNIENATGASLTAVSGIRFEFARTFGATRTFRVAGVFAMGRVPQGTSYEMSFGDNGTGNESAGIVLQAQPTAAISEYGVNRDLSFKFPDVDQFWYQYRIDWGGTLPAADDGSGGTPTSTFLYRKETLADGTGDARAIFVADMGITNNPYNDNNKSTDRAIFRPSPSPAGRGPVAGACSASWNDRLAVGCIPGGKNQVWISDQYFPWRFKALATDEDQDGVLDSDSGLSKSFPGETVTQLTPMPGALLGVAPLIAFTTERTYRFEGADAETLSRPSKLNDHGTNFPNSVSTSRGLIHYLDNDLIVRVFNGGIETQPISYWKVDDQLEAGDMSKCCATVFKEQYYLSHRASGASINQRVLLYNPDLDGWVRDSYSTANQNWAGLFVVGSGSTRKLIGITEECRVYQLEKSGQLDDDGTAISGTLTTGEINDGGWTQRAFGSVGVVVDDIASGTWTITRTNEYDTSDTGSGPGTINVDVSTTRAYRWETSSATDLEDSGIQTASVRISITGKVVNGKFLKAIVMKVSGERIPMGDRA